MKRILTFLCIAVSSYALFAQQSIRHTVNFSPYVVDSLYVDGNTYNTINIDSCDSYAEIGKPVLPVRYVRLLIPKGTRATGIVINQTSRLRTQTLLHKVSYGTPPVPAGETTEQETIGFDTTLYSQSTPYPLSRVSIIRKDYFRGNCIVTIAIYPILYTPAINQISYVSNIDFSLQYVTDTSLKKDMYFDDKDRGLLSHMIDNQNNIIAFAPLNISPNGNGTKNISVDSKYLIVTERNLIPAFAEFMDWKRRKGITIQAVAIEDILANYTQGDLVSEINDDAGNLRQFLSDAYQQHPLDDQKHLDYVLLAGANIPIRKGNWYQSSLQGEMFPTDLYFSDFDGNWDVDGDTFYGDWDDNIDKISEVYVGRIMPRNEWEVKNWTRKVLVYEQNPGNGDGSYLTKGFFTQEDFMQHHRTVQNYWYPVMENYISITLFEEQGGYNTPYLPNFPKGVDVISEYNNHYGIFGIFNHGSPNAITTASICDNQGDCEPNVQDPLPPPYAICSSDELQICTAENGNGLDNMTNYCYPTITYSISCITMPFDNYLVQNNTRNIGDSYTCVIKGGGPAYLGNTRIGGITDNGQNVASEGASFFRQAFEDVTYNLGKMQALAKEEIVNDPILLYNLNLMGCPETELWTRIPKHFNNVNIQEDGNSLLVNSGVNDVSICIMSALDNGETYYQKVENVSSFNFQNISKPYNVTITKHNYFPYLYNPNDIYIQNINWNNERVISANRFFIGSNVTNTIPFGNVIINAPANVLLNPVEDVIIQSDFEVVSGASFEIKTNNSNENTCL